MLANCAGRERGRGGGDTRFDRNASGSVEVHECVIAIEDHGLNVIWLVFYCSLWMAPSCFARRGEKSPIRYVRGVRGAVDLILGSA